jgi:hypothetical protein
VSRLFATSRADFTEIGCSSERPPKRIPTLSLDMQFLALVGQAVEQVRYESFDYEWFDYEWFK